MLLSEFIEYKNVCNENERLLCEKAELQDEISELEFCFDKEKEENIELKKETFSLKEKLALYEKKFGKL